MRALLLLALSFVAMACSSTPVPAPSPREPSSEVSGLFPLSVRPAEPYVGESKNAFGAARMNRKNAGVSLVAESGTEVRSIFDNGKVIKGPYAFYAGTYGVEVQYADGSIIRYGGLSDHSQVKVGDQVNKGSVIGHLTNRKTDNVSSLHLELYSGRAKGPLTKIGENEFVRRGDLQDPTPALRILERATFGQ